MVSLTDSRFEFTDFENAEVFWLLGLQRQQLLNSTTGFINQFPEDEVLLDQNLLVSLVHSTYLCFNKDAGIIPETYFVQT